MHWILAPSWELLGAENVDGCSRVSGVPHVHVGCRECGYLIGPGLTLNVQKRTNTVLRLS